MKKNNLIYILFTILIATFSFSCYDDKSTFADNPIESVVIDTTGIAPNLYVGALEMLNISPTISIGGNSDIDFLQYEWALSRSVVDSDVDFEVLSNESSFSEIIKRFVDIKPYTLRLIVTDTKNDNLQYICSWKIYVQSAFLDGLLVSDTKDEKTSDLHLILNKKLTMNYIKDETVFRSIVENAYGAPYNKLLSSLTYTKAATRNFVWGVTTDGEAVKFDCESFSIAGTMEDGNIIAAMPENLKFKTFFSAPQQFFALTSSGFYSLTRSTSPRFGYKDISSEGINPSNNIISSHSDKGFASNYITWYEEQQGQFVSYTGNQFSGGGRLESYEANDNFDPNDLPNNTAIAGIMNADYSKTSFLLKDKLTGQYVIYMLSPETPEKKENGVVIRPVIPARADRKFSIPEEGRVLLDKAVSVFFAQDANVLYIVTEDAVYSATFGSSDIARVYTEPRYTTTNGEKITIGKLYQQGQYTDEMSIIQGTIKPLEWNNRAIILATQKNSSEGKVYVIPINQAGIGTLDPSQALSVDGFARILDITTTGY